MNPRQTLEHLLQAALDAVHGGAAVRRVFRSVAGGGFEVGEQRFPDGTDFDVVAVGKAASAMAAAFQEVAGDAIARGLLVSKDGHTSPIPGFEVREAGHPVPDARSAAAADAVLELAATSEPGCVFVLLLSGGASALLSRPLPGLDAGELAETTDLLLRAGADIAELNAVRKHVFALGGGRLARSCGSERILVLALSDVPGDDVAVIGSGPCAVDPSTFADALAVIDSYALRARIPAAVLDHLEAGVAGRVEESAKAGDLREVWHLLVACSRDASEAAAKAAKELGLPVTDLGPILVGEAADRGRELAALARSTDGPCCLIAAGETTVTVRGQGQGGRNQELALAAAIELAGHGGCHLLCAGTDGSDGPTDAAGAFVDGGTVLRGQAHGLNAADHLARNDSYAFFALEGGLLRTGPTSTNVMDLAIIGIDLEKR